MGGRDTRHSNGGGTANPLGWLIELAKLSVVRNLAVGAVIALGVVAVLYVAFAALKPVPPAPQPPVIGPPQHQPGQPPEQPAEPVTPQPAPAGGFEWAKVIPPPPGMMDSVKFPEPSVFGADGQPLDSNTAVVEQNEDYKHWVSIMGPGKRMHMYQFRYGCGCPVMTTPDPYRDVVFAEPLKVAAEYKSTMCKACTELEEHLQSGATEDGNGEAADE